MTAVESEPAPPKPMSLEEAYSVVRSMNVSMSKKDSAFEVIKAQANAKNGKACWYASECYRNGWGTPPSTEDADKKLATGLSLHDPSCQYYSGSKPYWDRTNRCLGYTTVFEAAQKRHPEAMVLVADAYTEGIQEKQSQADANKTLPSPTAKRNPDDICLQNDQKTAAWYLNRADEYFWDMIPTYDSTRAYEGRRLVNKGWDKFFGQWPKADPGLRVDPAFIKPR